MLVLGGSVAVSSEDGLLLFVGSQGESLWLHLDIIKTLAAMCHEVFQGGSVQYAYTTIPTYPRCVTTAIPLSSPAPATHSHN